MVERLSGPLDLTAGGAYVHNTAGEYTRVATLGRRDGWTEVTDPVTGAELGHVRDNGWLGFEAVAVHDAHTYRLLGNRTTIESAISLLLQNT